MADQSDRYVEKAKLIGSAEKYWRPIHRAFDEKIRFLLDGEHYEDSGTDDLPKDRRLARWLGQESFHVHRHEVATVTAAPTQVHARPMDEDGGDANLAEMAVALVQTETDNPTKLFEDVCEDVVSSASACGLGWASVEMMRDEGPWGELYYASGDPRAYMRDPSVKSAHDLKCRWVCIRFRMTIREAKQRKGWNKKTIAALRPDKGYDARYFKAFETDQRLLKHPASTTGAENFSEDDEFTGYMLWERLPGEARRPTDYNVLEPGERYMACLECGWQSDAQDDAGHDLDEIGGPCPECGHHTIERIDAEQDEVSIHGYPNLNVCIVAPYAGVDDFLYDGAPDVAWRSYPVMELLRFRHILRPVGSSLADLNWWNQMCTDLVMTLAMERLMASAPIWSVPEDGCTDWAGDRFEFTDENGSVMFRDSSTPAGSVQLLEGTGIPAAWSVVYNNMVNGLTSHTGIADFGMGQDQSRDIAASSVAQQIQQQEIPTAHYQRRYQREKGRFYGLIFDGIREYPDERIYRIMGEDGADAVKAIRASSMPNYDFHMSDAPDFTALDEAKMKGAQLLIQTAQTQPEWLDFIASVNNVPPSVLRRVKQNIARIEAKQAQAPQVQAGQPPAGTPPDGQGTSPDSGLPPTPDMVQALMQSANGFGPPPQ